MPRNYAIALAVGLGLFATSTLADSFTAPQSSQTPFVVATAPGWDVTALISAGDSAKESPYVMAGIPDGMGAVAGKFAENGRYVADKAYMTIFLNHEINPTASNPGVPRAHGTAGAFVSQWTLHLNTLQMKWGEDLVQRVYTWQNGAYADTTGITTFNRFCSGDLPSLTGFYNPASGNGFDGLIYMNGEEADDGRAFAHVVTGDEKGSTYQLPYLGRFAWENSVAHPDAGDRTLVVGLDDSTPGQLYLYVGDKQSYGNPVERAGLQGGHLYGVKVTDGGPNYGGAAVTIESAGAINGTFVLHDVSTYALGTESELQAASELAGITEFARPEDGHWDPRNPNVFYWVTTGALGQTARLYKLTFDSIANPTQGTIELVVDSASLVGTDGAGARSFDNIVVDRDGNVIVQEDPGNSSYIAKIWKIDPGKSLGQPGFATQVFESDRERFLPGAPGFLTQDEENSGVIEVTDIVRNARWYEAGRRYYLANMQAHYNVAGEVVQGGQVYLIASPKK